MNRNISLIGVPTDIGASRRGASMGPDALRVAGLAPALEKLGYDVCDTGNLSGPVNPSTEPENGYRHLPETAAWCQGVRDAVYGSLWDGSCPVVMGGDHALAIGSLAGVSRYCSERDEPLWILWLDAHADYNTPATSPSGNLHGMPVAVACGQGPGALTGLGHTTPFVEASHIFQVGIRSIDAEEKKLLTGSSIGIYDMRRVDELGMRAVMSELLEHIARRGGHLHVSFDVDFLDPSIAPGVATTEPGGPNYREAQLCMEMIYECGLMRSLDIMELNPAYDVRNQTAQLAVALVKSLFGEQILARHERPSSTHLAA